MKRLIVTSFAAAFLLAGCGAKDAEYYSKHTDEAKEKLSECVKANTNQDKECSAAAEGLSRAMADKVNEMLKDKK